VDDRPRNSVPAGTDRGESSRSSLPVIGFNCNHTGIHHRGPPEKARQTARAGHILHQLCRLGHPASTRLATCWDTTGTVSCTVHAGYIHRSPPVDHAYTTNSRPIAALTAVLSTRFLMGGSTGNASPIEVTAATTARSEFVHGALGAGGSAALGGTGRHMRRLRRQSYRGGVIFVQAKRHEQVE